MRFGGNVVDALLFERDTCYEAIRAQHWQETVVVAAAVAKPHKRVVEGNHGDNGNIEHVRVDFTPAVIMQV